jgi:hypothetical protein
MTKAFVVIGMLAAVCGVAAQAPVPQALLTAKRAYLVNPAGDLKRFDTLADEFRKWGRFELVDDEEKADIIIEFGKTVKGHVGSFSGHTGNVTPIVLASLDIRTRGIGTPLWSDATGVIGSPGRLVSHLREHIEKSESKK